MVEKGYFMFKNVIIAFGLLVSFSSFSMASNHNQNINSNHSIYTDETSTSFFDGLNRLQQPDISYKERRENTNYM